jgi:hypothetical protein
MYSWITASTVLLAFVDVNDSERATANVEDMIDLSPI